MLPSPSAGIPSGIPTPSNTGTKRPAASDLQRTAGLQATPSKRHATNKASALAGTLPHAMPGLAVGSVATGMVMPVATMPSSLGGPPNSQPISQPPTVSEDQLVGRTPEQLIATILQMQAQHQQYVATISAQYNSIAQQLDEMRGSLAALYSAQASQYQTAASQIQGHQGYSEPRSRPVAPLASMLPQQSPSGPPRSSMSHSAPRPSRPPPQSPQSSHTDARLLPKQPTIQTPQTPGPPAYDYKTVGTVEEVWKEYREGIDGQPAVEELDSTWGSRWRPEPRGRTWYSRRKVIWDKIKEHIAEGMDEDEAVREVEKLRDGGTINKLIRMLQDERKDKGVPDDSTGA